MPAVDYNSFVKAIFRSRNLDKGIQAQIIGDLSDAAGLAPVGGNPQHLLNGAKYQNYNIVTRFIPPYCSTVTFYKDTIGFVTISRLAPDFDANVTDIGGGFFVTNGALATLAQAYLDSIDLDKARQAASHTYLEIDGPRGTAAHEAALPASHWDHGYIRLEWPNLDPPGTLPRILRYPPHQAEGILSNICQPFPRVLRLLFHRLCGSSKVSFQQGPAAVINDFLYKTHNGRYVNEVHIVGGELSAHLRLCGRILAFLNLNSTNAILAAIIALFTQANDGKVGLIISGSVLLGLQLWQAIWTVLITSTTYENVVCNEFRLRTEQQAAALFGLHKWYLRLLLAMISPQEDVCVHGNNNSYLDIAGMGVLDVSGPERSEIMYLAGYITSSLDPSEIDSPGDQYSCPALAAWVPYDTHRITYSANDKVRRFWMIDNAFHLSGSRRSSIEGQAGNLVFKHDGDALSLPKNLRIYSERYIG